MPRLGKKADQRNNVMVRRAVYFPRARGLSVAFVGATKCAMSSPEGHFGSTDIQNNTTGCTANTKVPGKVIRLIA